MIMMADHVSAVSRSGYYQLRQLRCVVQSLTSNVAKTLDHAFVSCRSTTVIRCCMALLMANYSDCSLTEIQRHG